MKETRLTAALTAVLLSVGLQVQADDNTTDSTLWYNQTHLLNEVTVKAQQPKTRLTGNSLITRIKGSTLEHVGTAKDMLAKVPGMTKNGDELEVTGRGTPIYYINGRRVHDDNELKQLRSEDVLSVEVITNPGSLYAATVTAVVRIKTVRRQGQGFGFDLTLDSDNDLRYGHYDPDGQLDLHYRWKNVDVFGMANLGYETVVQDTWLQQWSQKRTADGDLLHNDQTSDWMQTHRLHSMTSNLGFNWQIADNHSVGMRIERKGDCLDYNINTWQDTHISQWLERTPDQISNSHSYSTQDGERTQPYSWSGNAYYTGQVGKLGIELNVDFLTSKQSENMTIEEETDNANKHVITYQSPERNRLIADKLVLSYPIWKGQLQVGTEMTFVTRRSKYDIEGMALPATHSKVTENNIATFLEYACRIPQVGSISAGVRYEHVDFDYQDLLDATQSLSRCSGEFFPNISWARQWGPVQTALSYSLKTQRPSYWQLTETMTYINPYSLQQGDTKLKNEKIQQIGANARWKWMTLAVNYTHKKDALSQWSYVYNDEGVILIKNINLDVPTHELTAYINAAPTFGCYSPSWTVGIQKPKLRVTLADPTTETGTRTIHRNRPLGFLYLNNALRFKHSWQLEANANIMTKGDHRNYRFHRNTVNLELAAQKCWLKDDALCLRATVSDVLQRSRQLIVMDCGYYQLHQNAIYNRHRFDLTLTYSFNAAQSKYRGTGAGKEAQQRMSK